jgi:nitrite reductase/ring-hydroxylating ferredoxin subunit
MRTPARDSCRACLQARNTGTGSSWYAAAGAETASPGGARLSAHSSPHLRAVGGGRVRRRDVLGWLIAGGGLAVGAGAGGIGLLGILRKLGQRGALPRPAASGGIGSTAQAPNTARDFVNPHDGQAGLLIRLPDGTFVAYEKACTHKGVYVDYDQRSHQLVCPAHGAIFDPAQGGKVLQGPASRPLPAVTLKINTNGTITSG